MYNSPPSKEKWDKRLEIIEKANEEAQNPIASYFVSEQACALSIDIYQAYCAGAWISVIILAHAVADAALRGDDSKSSSAKIFGEDPDLTWLRKLRNSLVHAKNNSPVFTVDDIWNNQKKLEEHATKAIKVMFGALYSDSGT